MKLIQKTVEKDKFCVELQDVSTYYSGETKPAITNVWLKIPTQSLALIVGPNGSGKTTLLETILDCLNLKLEK